MTIEKESRYRITVKAPYGDVGSFDLNGQIEECDDGAEIVFASGMYFLENGIKLKGVTKRVTLRGEEGARLIGGKALSGATPVVGALLERFLPEVRDKVFTVDLRQNGVKDAGKLESRGFSRPVVASHSEIFADTVPFHLSRYPKSGDFIKITGYVKEWSNEWDEKVGLKEYWFKYDDQRPKGWAETSELIVHGYWCWDWANSYEMVDTIDKNNMVITTKPPYANYAFKPGQRFCFLNVLEEVSEPGDYYIDRGEMKLYFIPFEGQIPAELMISTLREPLIEFEGCRNIKVEGFTLEAGCRHAVSLKDCEDIKVNDLHIRNMGNHGVTIKSGKRITITGCTIHNCGDCGIEAMGGSRRTLEPANIEIDNNHIYLTTQWSRTYQAAVNVSGVGITVRNNLIHDCPHTGVLFAGNDISIIGNEIYSVLLETGDAGAIYTGRDYTFRGNVVSRNFIHHLGYSVGMGTMGIYNDDCVSGTIMENNIICEASRAVFLGGGRDFQVRGNLFVDCYPSIAIDGRGASSHKVWRKMTDELMRDRFYHVEEVTTTGEREDERHTVSAMRHPYITRYPELADIDAFYRKNSRIPPSAIIEYNVYCSNRTLEFNWDSEKGDFTVRSNLCVKQEDFEDYEIGMFNLKDGSKADEYGYQPMDILKPGLDANRRRRMPVRVMTGLTRIARGLRYRYKNLSPKPVEAIVTLYGSGEKPFTYSFGFSTGPNGEGVIDLPFAGFDKCNSIEARSCVPGVRPCRCHLGT